MSQRVLFLMLALMLIVGAVVAQPSIAEAQAQQINLRQAQGASSDRAGVMTSPSVSSPHDDVVQGSGKGLALLFWAFAAITIGGALFVITRKNLIAAVMGMVGSFLGISALYMMLYASFLAVVQMLVYAGAIMVLFVFVIMILNRPEDEPVGPRGKIGKGLAGLALLYLSVRLGSLLMSVKPLDAVVASKAPGLTPLGYDWGSTKAVGAELFTKYAFPFEAISILLLVAVVGAIAIARPLRDDAAESEEGA
jgi:NADH-quinone oxidoreductase subunit J